MREALHQLFFGTPRRALITVAIILILVAMGAIEALIASLTSLLISLLVLVILVWVIKVAVFGGHRSSGRRTASSIGGSEWDFRLQRPERGVFNYR